MLLVKVKYTRYNSSGDPHYCALMQEGKHHYLKKSRVDKFWQQTSELVRKFPRAIPEPRICLCLLQIACMTNFPLKYIRNYHICERERSILISKRSKRYNEIDTETYLAGEDSVSVDRRHASCSPSSSAAGWYQLHSIGIKSFWNPIQP